MKYGQINRRNSNKKVEKKGINQTVLTCEILAGLIFF